MADLILKVTPEEVRSKASDIDNQKTFMKTYLQDMQGKVNQLQEAWNSPSGQEYYTKFTTLSKQIEAALDDSNIIRFSGYLHKLVKDTQFIVITHRKGTMEAADRLYGITMQERGVSSLISVNLADVEEEEAI